MNEDIIDFFKDQRRNRPLSRFLDLEKSALVLHKLEHQGRTYNGSADWVTVNHAGKSGSMLRGQPEEIVTAPSSVVKIWRQKRLVQLVPPTSVGYDDVGSPWDTYALPKGRGFCPWDPVEDNMWAPRLPPTKYDEMWTPVRRYSYNWMKDGNWSEIFYLPWWICQKLPMKDEPSDRRPSLVIDLSEYLQTTMVTAAY
jgi:hypothetical protein